MRSEHETPFDFTRRNARALVYDIPASTDGNLALVPESLPCLAIFPDSKPPEDINELRKQRQEKVKREELSTESIELASDLIVNRGLKEAKWDSLLEMRRLIDDINIHLAANQSLTEAVSISANEAEINIRSYDAEITKQRPFLVHHNMFGSWNNQKRIVCNNGRPLVDAITPQERNGSVLTASVAIENFLLCAPENSFTVLMSPKGWNGFRGREGEELAHLNTQIMIFWKTEKGELKGGTIVVDLSKEHAREIMISFGVSKDDLNGEYENEELTKIVANPALLSFPRYNVSPFEFVLDRMLSVRGSADFRLLQQDGSIEVRSVESVRESIKRFDELLKLGEEEEEIVTRPTRFILDNIVRLRERNIQQEIIYKIEEAILLLTRKYLKDSDRLTSYQPQPFQSLQTEYFSRADDFSVEIIFLQSRDGCPPGGGSTRILSGVSFGSNALVGGEVLVESAQIGSIEFDCPKCGQKNMSNRRIKYCQHCNANVEC